MLIIITCLLLTLGYMLLMFAYSKGWNLQKDFLLQAGFVPHTTISIIIPARNEASNIGACLESMLSQKYPAELFEVIVVDDHSSDNTVYVANEYAGSHVRCLKLSEYIDENEAVQSYKKKAIALGIEHSRGELIITTDADCIAPNAWLMHIAAIYETQQPVMIVAPVAFKTTRKPLQLFQQLDFMSLQGITAAAHTLRLGNMSNGANLAFSKAAYKSVDGYTGIDHLASGDDYLLMMKLDKAFPGKIAYLKSEKAIIVTPPQPDWRSFLHQRIRWASKSGKYNDNKLTGILLFVYLFNLSFLALAIGGIFKPVLFIVIVVMLFLKTAAELVFLLPVAAFFKRTRDLRYFPVLQPVHIAYIIVAGFLGFLGSYEWKGRVIKQK